MRQTALQVPVPVQKGRRCSRHRSREFPEAHGEDHGEAPFPSTAHAGSWWSADPPAAHKGAYTRAGGCARRRL